MRAALVDVPTFKRYLGTELSRNDENLQLVLDTAETAVFQHLRRRVELVAEGAVASARLYVPATRWTVETDDFTALTSVVENGNTITSDYYQLEPVNNLSDAGEYRPYDTIRKVYSEWWRTDRTTATVTVTATWGWTEIPTAVQLAIMMVGKDLRASKDVQYGILFTDQAAVRIRQNPTVMEMLRDYRKDPVKIG